MEAREDPWRASLEEFLACAEGFRVALRPSQQEQILAFVQELVRWNRSVNLTGIREPRDVFVKHLLDSLVATRFLRDTGKLVDVGSGAGFPGIPLAIWRPEMTVLLVEARRKKAAFLRHVRRVLGLGHVVVMCGRAEEEGFLAGFKASPADAMISRATLGHQAALGLGDAIVGERGQIILMKGEVSAAEMEGLRGLCRSRQMDIDEVMPYRLPEMEKVRNVVVIRRRIGEVGRS